MSTGLDEGCRAEALVLSAALHTCARVFGSASLLVSLVTAVALIGRASGGGWSALGWSALGWCLPIVVVLERYLLARLVFDQRLFAQLGRGQVADLVALDGALHRLGLRSQPVVSRPWRDRLRGTRRLVWAYGGVVVLQLVLLAAVLAGLRG